MIKFKSFTCNLASENSFLLFNEDKELIFIDCGASTKDEWEHICSYIEKEQLKPIASYATHLHFDHLWGAPRIYKKYGIKTFCPSIDLIQLPNITEQLLIFGIKDNLFSTSEEYIVPIEENGEQWLGASLKILFLPGHSPGHVGYYLPEQNILFSGDVIFQEGIGRTDLWGGNYDQLIASIRDKIYILPRETKILCGHGPATFVEHEINHNPFLRL